MIISGNSNISKTVFDNCAAEITLIATNNGTNEGADLASENRAALVRAVNLSLEASNDPGDGFNPENLTTEERKSHFMLSHSTFMNNTSGFVGALFIQKFGKVGVHDSEFHNNTGRKTGAVHIHFSVAVKITSSVFLRNRGKAAAALISFVEKTLILSSVFRDNMASNEGAVSLQGRLASWSDLLGMVSTMNSVVSSVLQQVQNESQETNEADFSPSRFVNITNCSFVGNTSPRGGAVVAELVSLRVSCTRFRNNSAIKSTGASQEFFGLERTLPVMGGAILTLFGKLNVTQSTFRNNSAELGGAIWSSSTIHVHNSSFIENSVSADKYALASGGAVWVATSAVVRNSTFESNKATIASAVYAGQANISESTFSANVAMGQAGTILATRCIVQRSLFEDNRAPNGNGGALLCSLLSDISHTTFIENTAISGGAICLREANLLCDACVFKRNIAR